MLLSVAGEASKVRDWASRASARAGALMAVGGAE